MLSTLLVAILSLNFFPFVLCSVCVHFVDVSHPSPLRGACAGIRRRCRCLCSLLPYTTILLYLLAPSHAMHTRIKRFPITLLLILSIRRSTVRSEWTHISLPLFRLLFLLLLLSLSTLHCCTVGRWGNRFIMPILHSAVHLFLFFLESLLLSIRSISWLQICDGTMNSLGLDSWRLIEWETESPHPSSLHQWCPSSLRGMELIQWVILSHLTSREKRLGIGIFADNSCEQIGSFLRCFCRQEERARETGKRN